MDMVWLLAGAAFFVGSAGLVRFIGSLQGEE